MLSDAARCPDLQTAPTPEELRLPEVAAAGCTPNPDTSAPLLTDEAISEFAAQTHVLLGIQTCARCGRPHLGSTVCCFTCLEQQLEQQAAEDQPLSAALSRRADFLQRVVEAGPPNPAAPVRVFRYGRARLRRAG